MDNTQTTANAAPPAIRVGLPHSAPNEIAAAAEGIGAPTLISAGGLFRANRGGFQTIGRAAWHTAAALDSAGFVAMLQGGYRWDVTEYVEFVVTNSGEGAMPFPWGWWSAMDYCCEPEIAADWAEVEARIDATIESYGDTLAELDWWRGEGDTDTPDPLPILQGRLPADYIRCANELTEILTANGRKGLPALIGIGSVCRRNLHGEEGLLTILDALHAALPAHVKLHLFGVKGAALKHLAKYGDRVAAIDSMAWDKRATEDALEINRAAAEELGGITLKALKELDREEGERVGPHWYSNTNARRAVHLTDWFNKQSAHAAEAFGVNVSESESKCLHNTPEIGTPTPTETPMAVEKFTGEEKRGLHYVVTMAAPAWAPTASMRCASDGWRAHMEWVDAEPPECGMESSEGENVKGIFPDVRTVIPDPGYQPMMPCDIDKRGFTNSTIIFLDRRGIFATSEKSGVRTYRRVCDFEDFNGDTIELDGVYFRQALRALKGDVRLHASNKSALSAVLFTSEHGAHVLMPRRFELTSSLARCIEGGTLTAAAIEWRKKDAGTWLAFLDGEEIGQLNKLPDGGWVKEGHLLREAKRDLEWHHAKYRTHGENDGEETRAKTERGGAVHGERAGEDDAHGESRCGESRGSSKHEPERVDAGGGIGEARTGHTTTGSILSFKPTTSADLPAAKHFAEQCKAAHPMPITGLRLLSAVGNNENAADMLRALVDTGVLVCAGLDPKCPSTFRFDLVGQLYAHKPEPKKRPAKPAREVTPGGVVLAELAKIPNMSPSALGTKGQCTRKWWLNKVARIDMPATTALTTGIKVHNILEAHLKGEELPTYTARLHGIAKAGMHLLPSGDDVLVEQWVGRKESPLDCGGLAYKGKIDLFDPEGKGAPKAGPKGLIWIGDHKTSSDPAKWGLRPDELATNHQVLSYAYGIVTARGIPAPERIALTHFYYRTRGLPLGSRVDAKHNGKIGTPWQNVLDAWAHFESEGREMRQLADATDSRRIKPNPNNCFKYNTLCPFAGICNDSPTAKKKRRLTRVFKPKTESIMPPKDTEAPAKSAADVAAWLMDDDDAPAKTETRDNATKNPALSGSDGGANPTDAAPEMNPTKALMNEVAEHARNTLEVLSGAMPGVSFKRIFERNGLEYTDAHVAYVLSKVPAHVDGSDVRSGAAEGAAPLAIAPEPTAEPRPKDKIDTSNADAAASSADMLEKIDAGAMAQEHKNAVSALYRATFDIETHKMGRIDEKDGKALAKEASGWARFTNKRWAAIIKDGSMIGAIEQDPGDAVVRIGGVVGGGAGSTGETTKAPPAGEVAASSGDDAAAPATTSGKPTPPKLPEDPAPRFKEGLEEHTDGEKRSAQPYKEGSVKESDWLAGWDYGAAQAAYVVELAEWELAESARKEAEAAAAKAAAKAAAEAAAAKTAAGVPSETVEKATRTITNALAGLTLYVDCAPMGRLTLSLPEYLAPFERTYIERNPKCAGYAYSEAYNAGAKGVAALLTVHLMKTAPDFGALFVSSRHPAYSDAMAVLECVPGVEIVRAMGSAR